MRRRIIKYAAVLAALLLTAGLLAALLSGRSDAIFNEEDAVHIDPDEIPQSTLIVGTHLIYLGSVTDKLYETAAASAKESGQIDIYYKSELGGGRWYAVNDAGSIKDISVKEKEIPKSRIKELYLTHHTKSDGYTYRLKDNAMVSIYDIESPYDLEGMKELSALLIQKNLNGKGAAVFEAKVDNEVTKWCDKSLDKLNKEYIKLKTAGADAGRLEALDRAMGKVDSLRRSEVYKKLKEEVQKLLDDADSGDAGYNEALSETLAEIEDSLAEAEANKLDKEAGVTVMTGMESGLIQKYIENPGDDILKDMDILKHIMDGVSASPQEEAEFLKERLIPAAEAAYKESRSESAKNELEYYKNELNIRESGTSGTGQQLKNLYDEKAKLQEERLSALDEENLPEAKRIEALIEVKSREIQEEENAISKEAESCLKQKTGLEEQLRKAGTEEEKERIENEIEKLDKRMAELGEAADGGASSAQVQKIVEEAETALSEGTDGTGRLAEAVEGLGALCGTNPGLAGASLKNLYEKTAARKYLDDTKIYDSILEGIEAVLAENMEVLEGEPDTEKAVQVMEETAGKNKTAALMGLSMFVSQTAGSGLENLLEGKVKAYAGEEGAYVFPGLSMTAGKRYASADVTARYASMRYIWNDNKKRATLASREGYYKFTAFDSTVIHGPDKEKEKLSMAAGFKRTVYIPEDYVKQEFGCEVYDIPGTGYCILIDQGIADKAAEVCDALSASL